MPMTRNKTAQALLVVVMALTLVHGAGQLWPADVAAAEPPLPNSAPKSASKAIAHEALLPAQVLNMRDMILAAVHSGRTEDLQPAIEQNELPPEFGAGAGADPVAHLKTLSADGSGREILALLGNLLQSDPVRLPIGRDLENNGVYVWPAVSEADLTKLTPADEVAIYRLMPVAEAKALIASKKWTWWRLAIGADGTWLTFMKYK